MSRNVSIIVMCAVIIGYFVFASTVRADEPAPVYSPPDKRVIAPMPPPVTPPQAVIHGPDEVPKPGEIFQYGADSTFKKVDMSKFFVLGIDWQPPFPFADYQIGLRADGVVVWRKVAK